MVTSAVELIFKRFKRDDNGFFIDVTNEAVDELFEDIMKVIVNKAPRDVMPSALHVTYCEESGTRNSGTYTIKRNCRITTRTITDFA